MTQTHKYSFYIILGLIFLIPLFFIPGNVLALGMAKSALFVIGTTLATLVFAWETWRNGGVVLPKHSLVLVVGLLPVVYLLSALLATPSSLSLFGYGFEIGTFGYMLVGSALLLLVSSVFTESAKALQALVAFFLSFSILAIFSAIKVIFGGDILVLGNFATNMGNPVGSWTDLGLSLGLLAVFAALTLGMIPMRGAIKWLLYGVFAVAAALMVVVNFQTAFIFTLAASILMFFYFSKIEGHFLNDTMGEREEETGSRSSRFGGAKLLPIILGVISLVFLVNPSIGGERTLGGAVSGAFGINNAEVRPSFSATLGVSKAVLSQAGLLGSGPNTFGQDWLIYKPANINSTPFWATAFPFGAGFLPTQIATTGILGSALWLAFFVLLVVLGIRAVTRVPETRGERFVLISTLLGSLFLWGACFFYAPSGTVLMLAFVFTGLFVASLLRNGLISSYVVDTRKAPQALMASTIVLVLVVAGALFVGWTGIKKTVSAYHFNQAVALSNTEGAALTDIENKLSQAIDASPADIYYVALSRLNFSRAQIVAQSATGTPEQNQAVFQESISRSIGAAQLAVNVNPAGFENWVALGNVYTALVPKPIALEGAYESAQGAYGEAVRRNPNNPELYLLLAQLELNNESADRARAYIMNAISLKQDYADAYLMLAQLEVSAGNTPAAIQSAEALAVLVPNNPGIHFEIGVLKFSSKDYTGAAESLGKAIELSKDYANAKYYLALSLANLGRFAEAQVQLEDLLSTNPANPDLEAALTAVKANKVPPLPTPSTASTQ